MRHTAVRIAPLLALALLVPQASAETPADVCDWILQRHNNGWGINLLDFHPGSTTNPNSTALQNIKDCKQGQLSDSGDGCSSADDRVQLRMDMLTGMRALRQDKNFTFRVTEIAGGSHTCPSSYHYKGRAFDVDRVNGAEVNSSNPHEPFRQACIALGADEAYGPGYDPYGGHSTHIHCAWAP